MPLPTVLRWADDRVSVEVRDSAPPGAPLPASGRYHSVQIWLALANEPGLSIDWNLGCDYGLVHLSGLFFNGAPHASRPGWPPHLRCQGLGTLVVNIGIQYLRTLYPGPDAPFTTELTGVTVAHWAASAEAEWRDVEGRARFWMAFGFQVGGGHPGVPGSGVPHAPSESIVAPLWRLTVQPGGRLFRQGSPRGSRALWVPLAAFDRVCERSEGAAELVLG